jgi:alpha-L-rhamnosidase
MNHPFSQSSWIASGLSGSPRASVPVPFLRKSFSIDKEVKTATLSATALGIYECEVNGERVGDLVFAPGWTDYAKRIYYQTYDVTPLLRQGENVWGAILGDGWYCGALAWNGRQNYGEKPAFLGVLEIVFIDGSGLIIGTDGSWRTAFGPLTASDFLAGENYDARKELTGWSAPGYDDGHWTAVQTVPASDAVLGISPGPPVRRMGELPPVSVQNLSTWPKPGRLIDFGQNFSGRVRLRIEAPRGTTLKIFHAEVLDSEGRLYTENLRGATAVDYYTCKGGGVETWEPRFTFHGFRYVEVNSIRPKDFLEVTGIVLHSDLEPTGSFSCSNPLLNQLQHNIVWGQKSNFLEVPTDCPQRDERLGWTGDAQVFIRTACFNMDVRGFFHKWMQDVRDAQGTLGGIPTVVPQAGFDPIDDSGPAWSDATIICPWTIYLCYGDRQILAEHYESMRRYLDFLVSAKSKDLIRSHPSLEIWRGFGDWLALDGSGRREGGTPFDLIGTAFLAYDAQLMSRIASILGHEEDAQRFKELHSAVTDAFRRRFVTPEGLLASGTQTAYLLALHFDLVPEDAKSTAVGQLVRDIEQRGFHLATGFVGTPYLLDVLEANGHLEVAYKLLEQETFPSWLFPVKNGATTIWERWDGWTAEKGFQDKEMNSFNHYAYGAVGAWMYRSVAGLDLDSDEPGYRHVVFRPRPGGSVTWAEARLKTPQGAAAIRWEIGNDGLDVDLLVPEGSKATFLPPQSYVGNARSFGAGAHSFTLRPLEDVP